MNQFQDLTWADRKIEARIQHNKQSGNGTSVSGLFSMLRKERHLDLIGDYPIMFEILTFAPDTKRGQIQTMAKKSSEYKTITKKEKMQWVQGLSDYASKILESRLNEKRKRLFMTGELG